MKKPNIGNAFKTGVEYAKDGQVIAGAVIAIVGAAAAVIELVDEHKNELVVIPELYGMEYPFTLTQASEVLSDAGLNMRSYPLTRKNANIQYKDCFDFQVVGSSPEQGKKVKPGSAVVVRYLTKEAVEESKRLSAKSEKEENDKRLKKIKEREARKEKAVTAVKKILSVGKNG